MATASYHLLGRRASPPPPPAGLLVGEAAADFYLIQDAAARTSTRSHSFSPAPRSLHPLADAFYHTSFPVALAVTFSAFCFFVLLGICMWNCCYRGCRRRDGGHDMHGGEAASPGYKRRDHSGVDRAVVESLPVVPFRRRRRGGGGTEECAVCLRRFAVSDLLRVLPKCMHAFHVGCVDTWLAGHCTCPICRRVVEPEDVLLPLREPLAGPEPHPAARGAVPLEEVVVGSVNGGVMASSPQPHGGRKKPRRCRSVDDALLLRGAAGEKQGQRQEDHVLATGDCDGEGVLKRRWSDVIQREDLRGVLRRDMVLVDVDDDGDSVWRGRVSSCSCAESVDSSASSSSVFDAGVGWRGAPGTAATTAPLGGPPEGLGGFRRWLTAAAKWLARPR